jgi:hypothetical protein
MDWPSVRDADAPGLLNTVEVTRASVTLIKAPHHSSNKKALQEYRIPARDKIHSVRHSTSTRCSNDTWITKLLLRASKVPSVVLVTFTCELGVYDDYHPLIYSSSVNPTDGPMPDPTTAELELRYCGINLLQMAEYVNLVPVTPGIATSTGTAGPAATYYGNDMLFPGTSSTAPYTRMMFIRTSGMYLVHAEMGCDLANLELRCRCSTGGPLIARTATLQVIPLTLRNTQDEKTIQKEETQLCPMQAP